MKTKVYFNPKVDTMQFIQVQSKNEQEKLQRVFEQHAACSSFDSTCSDFHLQADDRQKTSQYVTHTVIPFNL